MPSISQCVHYKDGYKNLQLVARSFSLVSKNSTVAAVMSYC